MPCLYKNRWINRATAIYWLLLIYVLAALIWWFIALNLQNNRMAEYKLGLLKHDDISYIQKVEKIYSERDRMITAYVSEGLVFLFVILIGAVFLYSSVMRQIRIQKQQQNFMMAITHELKTPISIARLNIETLQKHNLDETKREKILKYSLQEINRLNTHTETSRLKPSWKEALLFLIKRTLIFMINECCQDLESLSNRPWDSVGTETHLTRKTLLMSHGEQSDR
jgi:signal transduction histidine kinase